MTNVITGTVEAPGAVLTYDVRQPETPSGHLPLFIFGSPMAASGVEPIVFPGDHGGFTVSPMSPDNDPAAFAATLRDVLDHA